jgi:PKD repeat protein
VDDRLVLDSWQNGSEREVSGDIRLDAGEHDVRVEYYEAGGSAVIQVEGRRIEQPSNQRPVAAAGGPYQVNEGGAVTLDGSGSRDPDGQIARYEWDFNYDGNTFDVDATGRTVEGRYADGPARPTVALRVTDNQGASHTATTSVEVRNVAPSAEAGGPYTGRVGSAVRMAAAASDPSSADRAVLVYRWSFGDGTTAAGQEVTHTFDAAGTYQVTLRVNDKDGGEATDTATVNVSAAPVPPTADIEGPQAGQAGEELAFDASGSSDPDGQIARYEWDFGDGATATGQQVRHTYAQAGRYTLTLRVTDNDGQSDIATQTVDISPAAPENRPPTAAIQGPQQGQVGQELTFSPEGSQDPDGRIVEYAWNFGDGTADVLVSGTREGGARVAHIYAGPGTYTVTLRVTDDGGLTGRATQQVQVTPAAPENRPPTAAIQGPSQGQAGEELTFSPEGSQDPDGEIVEYAWDFGDGSPIVVVGGAQNGAQVTHTYDRAGNYTLRLRVTDDGGLTATASHPVQIDTPPPANRPPTAAIQGPSQGLVGEELVFSGAPSEDPDGRIVQYAWDFGDEAPAVQAESARDDGGRVIYAYRAPGTYTIRLTVTDDGGLTATATQQVQISAPANMAPLAAASGPVQAAAGQALRFDGRGSQDRDGQIAGYAWNFGDGATAAGAVVTHTYASPGNYGLVLTVTDDGGLTDTTNYTVRIDQPAEPNQPPVAAFTAPETAAVGQQVVFDAGASSDLDGRVVQYTWYFGDGSQPVTKTIGADRPAVAGHAFPEVRRYRVTLVVTDERGYSARAVRVIQIVEPGGQTSQAPATGIRATVRELVGGFLR